MNIKCGGCVASIVSAMEKKGFKDVGVDLEKQTVSFEGAREEAKKILSGMGYPEAGTPEADSMMKQARSYVSCAIGKMKQ